MNEPDRERAVVLLSGGVDSSTVLAIARSEGFDCIALSFDYGQRHKVELESAKRVAAALGVTEHRVVAIDMRAIGGSALTSDEFSVPKDLGRSESVISAQAGVHDDTDGPRANMDSRLRGNDNSSDIPVTYVPARNTIFLSVALGVTEVSGARDIFIGVNAIDYSGYPDCRPAFIEQFETLANLATKAGVEGERFRIHAPLIAMTKKEIIERGMALGVDYALTMSCYDPRPRPRSGDGRVVACGRCDSCRLRAEGFRAAGLVDPAMAGR